MTRSKAATALPVAAAVITGLAVFFLFGGRETVQSSGRYACPMLCVVLEAPGLCPVCGMELAHLQETGDTVIVSGRGSDLIGLTTVEAEYKSLETPGRYSARVLLASQSVVEATSWADGRITDLRIEGPGETVQQGQILAVLHSPQIQSARIDYQAAVASGDEFLVLAASNRLQELGTTAHTGNDLSGTYYIRAPVSGTIGEVLRRSGTWLSRGTAVATVIESEGRELKIDIPEAAAEMVSPGLPVTVNYNGDSWTGTVDRMEAQMNFQTQTLPVYAVIPDSVPLVPGSYVIASISLAPRADAVLTIPESAVLSLGERHVIYVQLEATRYVPRVIRVGELSFDEFSQPFYPVLEGLSAGERVVLDGAFLLDSQAELTGVTSLMNTGEDS